MIKLNINSILVRLFLSFLLIIALIMATGILMFLWEKETIKAQIIDSAMDNISFLKTNFENEIYNIKQLQYNLASDTILNKLATQYQWMTKSEYYLSVVDVQQRLKVIKNSNSYIKDVAIYFPGMKYKISAEDGYHDFDDKEYKSLFKSQLDSKYPLIIDKSRLFSTSVHPNVFKIDDTPLYLAVIDLPEDKIREFIARYSKYSESNTAIYDYASGTWLFNTQSELGSTNDARLSLITGSSGNKLNTTANIEGKDFYIISEYSGYLNVSFIQYVPIEDIFRVPNQYGSFLWYYAALSFVIMVAYAGFIYKFVKSPMNTLLASFQRVEAGYLDTRVQQKAASEFNDLFEGFNKMVFHLNELIDRVYKQEIYAKNAELKQLQSQINPHFLYNSYFLLYRMLRDQETENAESLACYLGEYFKHITRNAAEMVSLQKEVDHARNYAHIQQMRFPERLTVTFGEIPEKYRAFMVPRVFLQPMIENAFEHGLKTTKKDGFVKVDFEDTGTGLLISIEDSGCGLQESDIEALQNKLVAADESMETTGIINVHKRIMLGYGPASGITFIKSGYGGLKVEIRINPKSENHQEGNVKGNV